MSNPRSLVMTFVWLAALGLVIVLGTRVAGNVAAKTGV